MSLRQKQNSFGLRRPDTKNKKEMKNNHETMLKRSAQTHLVCEMLS